MTKERNTMAARKKASKAKAKTKKVSKVKKATKSSVKRAVSKKAAPVKSSGPIKVGRKPFSKSQIIAEITTRTGLARKDVVGVLDNVAEIIGAHVSKGGPEVFNWPGLFKIMVVKKPATKARQGINPFTGETMMFKAKPASRRIKVRALKQLKEMAA